MAAEDAVQRPAPCTQPTRSDREDKWTLVRLERVAHASWTGLCAPLWLAASARSDTIDCGKPTFEEICHGKLFQHLLD